MKKVLSKVALAGLGVAMVATSANAASIAIDGPLYFANEALSSAGVESGDIMGVGGTTMIITTSIKNPSNLVFSMTGGSLSVPDGGTYVLGVLDADDVVVNTVTDTDGFDVIGSAVNGEVVFEPNDGAGLKAGADTDLLVGSRLVFTNPLNFDIAADQAHNGTYTIQVAEANGEAESTTFATGANQYDVCVWNLMDATIDLEAEPSRTTFMNEQVQDWVHFVLQDRRNNCGPQDGITGNFLLEVQSTDEGGSLAEFAMNINSSDQAIETFEMNGTEVDFEDGGWSSDGGWFGNWHADSVATVTGEDPIEARDFTAELVSEPESDDYLSVTYTAEAGEWKSAGYSAEIPYIPFGAAGFTAFLKVANQSDDTSGDISITAVCTEFVAGVAGETVTGGGVIKSSPAGSNMTVGQAEMASVIGLEEGLYHCAINLFVDVEAESVRAAGFQSDPVGRTDLPLYPNNFWF